MGEIVNKQRLSTILGKSERTLTEWQKQGMPVERAGKRGQSNRYDTAKVIAWYLEREMGALETDSKIEDEEKRLVKARADKLEIELEILKGNLVDAEQIEFTWKTLATRVRAKLLAMPTRLAANCEWRKAPEIKNLIEEAVHEALNELADGSEAGGDPEDNIGDPGELKAAAEA